MKFVIFCNYGVSIVGDVMNILCPDIYIYLYIYFKYIVSHSSPIKKKKKQEKTTTPSGAPHQTPGLAPGALMTTMVKNRDSQWINVDNGIYREHRITKLIFFSNNHHHFRNSWHPKSCIPKKYVHRAHVI